MDVDLGLYGSEWGGRLLFGGYVMVVAGRSLRFVVYS